MSYKRKKSLFQLVGTVAMVMIALILGGVMIALTGNPAVSTYGVLLNGAFGTSRKISELFVKLIPILLMSFGISIAFKAKLWNIGAEGQFIMASIAGVVVGLYVKAPAPITIVFSFVAAAGAGALWAGLAGWLKNRFNANEVITTLMLNYIASYFLLYLINGPMQDPYSDLAQSDILPENLQLPFLFEGTRLHTGIIILIVVIIFMIVLWHTSLGYKIDLIGQGDKIATYAGVNVKKTVIVTMLLSGALCGMAGWCELFGIQYRLLDGLGADYGNIANIIALLGSLNVYGVMAAAAFFSILLCGGASMQRMTDVPYSVIGVIEGLIIILVIAKDAFANRLTSISGSRERKKEKLVEAEEKKEEN